MRRKNMMSVPGEISVNKANAVLFHTNIIPNHVAISLSSPSLPSPKPGYNLKDH